MARCLPRAPRGAAGHARTDLYYDYAKGAGNGALLPGRAHSSFTLESDWRRRPWPPQDKYRHSATDAELGL